MKIAYIENPFPHNEKVEKYNKKIKNFKSYPLQEAEILVCGGGDGTLLKTIREHSSKNKIFWGYNAGTKGFLMNNSFPFEVSSFEKIPLKVIHCKIHLKNGEIKESVAFNDVAIGGDMNTWCEFKVKGIKGFPEKEFYGGGLIISTPIGSTGISKNAGGIVLPLNSNLWAITSDKCEKRIRNIIEDNKSFVIDLKSRTEISVWIDGNAEIYSGVEKVQFSKGECKSYLAVENMEEFLIRRERYF